MPETTSVNIGGKVITVRDPSKRPSASSVRGTPERQVRQAVDRASRRSASGVRGTPEQKVRQAVDRASRRSASGVRGTPEQKVRRTLRGQQRRARVGRVARGVSRTAERAAQRLGQAVERARTSREVAQAFQRATSTVSDDIARNVPKPGRLRQLWRGAKATGRAARWGGRALSKSMPFIGAGLAALEVSTAIREGQRAQQAHGDFQRQQRHLERTTGYRAVQPAVTATDIAGMFNPIRTFRTLTGTDEPQAAVDPRKLRVFTPSGSEVTGTRGRAKRRRRSR